MDDSSNPQMLQSTADPVSLAALMRDATMVTEAVSANCRIAGLCLGKIWADGDFDEPLSDGFWTGETK